MEFGIRKSSCLDSADSEATWLRCCTMIYLVFAPGFWNEACKVLVISQVLGALTSPAFVIKSWLRIAASSQVPFIIFCLQHVEMFLPKLILTMKKALLTRRLPSSSGPQVYTYTP
ncbi:hypothetical protein LEMLEM_LOCUS23113, partial [Lemmus lemmus]